MTTTYIRADKLAALLSDHLYRTVAVRSSIGGGWFVQRLGA